MNIWVYSVTDGVVNRIVADPNVPIPSSLAALPSNITSSASYELQPGGIYDAVNGTYTPPPTPDDNAQAPT